MMSEEVSFREDLPEGCPPYDAISVKDGTVLYRLVSSNPPTDADFDSWRAQNPRTPCPGGLCECRARGVSVHDDVQVSEKLKKLSKFRGSEVAKLVLAGDAGKIKKTGGKAHYDWWPFADYDIIAVCEVVS